MYRIESHRPLEHLGARTAILLVESDPAETELLLELFADVRLAGHAVEVTHVRCIAAAVELLGLVRPDAIVLDLHPPEALRLDALRRLRAASCGAPVVVLTGIEQPALARDAIRLGAEEFIFKRALDGERLMAAVLRARERARVRRAASVARAAFRRTLTGLEEPREPVHPRSTRVDATVRGVVALFDPSTRAKGVRIRLDLAAREVELETDPLRLRELLVEMIGRAVRESEAGTIDVSVLDVGDGVLVEVSHPTRPRSAADLDAAAMALWPGDASVPSAGDGYGDANRLSRLARLIGGELHAGAAAGARWRVLLRLPRGGSPGGAARARAHGLTLHDGGSNG